MGKRILFFFLVMILPFSLLTAKEVNLKVSVDYANFSLESLNVKFTSKGVPGTAQMETLNSNFKDYDTLPALTYTDSGNNSFTGINLVPINDGKLFYAESKNDCYISWQAYTKGSACVYLSLDGPLKSTLPNSGATIDWQVYMDAATHNNQVADSTIPESRITVVTTLPSNFGVTGARKFHVKTSSLWDKPFESYKANIIATIEAVV